MLTWYEYTQDTMRMTAMIRSSQAMANLEPGIIEVFFQSETRYLKQLQMEKKNGIYSSRVLSGL